ncbi:MAG TPA: secretin N-terminal domain-containing protein [Candidatus Polarisedimenticolia bacterium]|nr:secretin N-terminal domain-containing protein [Candidatus Polarisedimenticolia bacterium]
MKTTKSKLHIPAGVLLILFLSLSHSFAQGTPGAPMMFDPTTGQPINAGGGGSSSSGGFLGVNPPTGPAQPAFDPTTGVPIASPAPPGWKDDSWADPDITLARVSYANLPLAEIARNLRAEFKDQFDILLPASTTGNNSISQVTGMPMPDTDWNTLTVQLELRNVTASEIFNAMNLIFENDQTPLRWELRVNGHRQLAVLHVLIQHGGSYTPQEVRKVYFVGDLIGDEKNGGMSMQDIIKTITDVWKMSGDSGGKIQFHEDAQLLVVTGSPSQVDFMIQTLAALRQKVDLAREKHARAAKTAGGGTGGSQNN